MLRKRVGRVLAAWDLSEFEIAFAQAILNPQIRHMQVSDLSQAAASAYTDRRCSVSENLKIQLDSQIVRQRLETEGDGCTTTYAAKFGLAG